jgi:thiosulfate/3-mercaptopyruvate sulfurtransferase
MSFETIVSTKILADHLLDPDWVVIDTRFDLLHPQWGNEDYQRAHIPGAVYADLSKDLSRPASSVSGRHPLPELGDFIAFMSSCGVDKKRQVVVYDTSNGALAVRLWWLLKYYGHAEVAVLDGGLQLWQNENRAIKSGIEQNDPAHFEGKPNASMEVDSGFVSRVSTDPNYCVVDARAAIRYQGLQEPIDPVAGHIPGAVNRFHALNLSKDGTFLPAEVLQSEFQSLMAGTNPENVIVYCGSGVTSCHHILAMEIAGLPGARLYVGSWSEWIRDPNRPIIKKSG